MGHFGSRTKEALWKFLGHNLFLLYAMKSNQGSRGAKGGCYWYWKGTNFPASGISCYAGVKCKFDHSKPPTEKEIEKFEKPITIAIISHFAQCSREQWDDPSSIEDLQLKLAVLSCQTDACKCGLETIVKDSGAMRVDMPTLVAMGISKRKAANLKETSSSSSSSEKEKAAVEQEVSPSKQELSQELRSTVRTRLCSAQVEGKGDSDGFSKSE